MGRTNRDLDHGAHRPIFASIIPPFRVRLSPITPRGHSLPLQHPPSVCEGGRALTQGIGAAALAPRPFLCRKRLKRRCAGEGRSHMRPTAVCGAGFPVHRTGSGSEDGHSHVTCDQGLARVESLADLHTSRSSKSWRFHPAQGHTGLRCLQGDAQTGMHVCKHRHVKMCIRAL